MGNKDENLSEQQVYILPYTPPDNPQTLLINKILSVLLNFLRPGRLGRSTSNYNIEGSMKELAIIL